MKYRVIFNNDQNNYEEFTDLNAARKFAEIYLSARIVEVKGLEDE
jgi:hypothetical protein